MKSFYNILKAGNHWFATYYMYYKAKFRMIKSIYNLCLFFKSGLWEIVKMQIKNILILVDNNFTNTKEGAIKLAKIVIKDKKYLIFIHLLKFYSI